MSPPPLSKKSVASSSSTKNVASSTAARYHHRTASILESITSSHLYSQLDEEEKNILNSIFHAKTPTFSNTSPPATSNLCQSCGVRQADSTGKDLIPSVPSTPLSTVTNISTASPMPNGIDKVEALAGVNDPQSNTKELQTTMNSASCESPSIGKAVEDLPNECSSSQFENKAQSKEFTLIQNRLNELESSIVEEEQFDQVVEKAYRKAVKELNTFLASGVTLEEKVESMKQKFIHALAETKRYSAEAMKFKRTEEILVKEKAFLKIEMAKSSTIRIKLEQLCRELQKENKRIKEETRKLAILEQRKRDELSLKFEDAITEITSKMDDSSDESIRRVDDNEKLKEKFYGFLEQYELRERHFNSVVKAKDLEIKLLNAKLEHRASKSESSSLSPANDESSTNTNNLTDRLRIAEANESQLKEQLSHYVEKFKQVEETLGKSNDLFSMFRKEMETMTARVTKLEKEKQAMKSHCEEYQKNCLELYHEKNQISEALEDVISKKDKLEHLCRALQAQRKSPPGEVSSISPMKLTSSSPSTSSVQPPTLLSS